MHRITRKRRTREHVIADLGINHVERIVLRCGHTVERYWHDYGFDLQLHTYDNNGECEHEESLMAMTRKITFADLCRLLESMEFERITQPTHVLFEHHPSNTMLVLRPYKPR